MEKLVLPAAVRAPQIDFDPETGVLELSGRSIPENSYELYQPILAWADGYAEQPATHTLLEFKLTYFNSSSAEHILDLLKTLRTIAEQPGHTVEIRWHFEANDEDMQQVAEDFQQMLGMPIEMVVRESEE